MGNYPSRYLNVQIGQFAAQPVFFERRKAEKLRTRLLLKKSGGRGATRIVKGFGKEEKLRYQAFVSILIDKHSQVLETIPHCHRAHLEFLGQYFDRFIVI